MSNNLPKDQGACAYTEDIVEFSVFRHDSGAGSSGSFTNLARGLLPLGEG